MRFKVQSFLLLQSLASVALAGPGRVTNRVNPSKHHSAQTLEEEAQEEEAQEEGAHEEGAQGGLDPLIGHGITTNFKPRFSPPIQTERVPEMMDLLTLRGSINHL